MRMTPGMAVLECHEYSESRRDSIPHIDVRMAYDSDKHHRRSIRLRAYDYAQAGAYFVTICTQGRRCLFGDVLADETRLTEAGRIVQECWDGLPQHFPDVQLDEFVVMPNHVHGIVVVDRRRGTACRAPTGERFGRPEPGSLPTIIRSFKSAATKRINDTRRSLRQTVWQRGYFERVIRDEKELDHVRQYIRYNPMSWQDDKENPDNQKVRP